MSTMFVVFAVTCLFVVAWPDRPTYPWDASPSGVSGRVSCFQGQGKGRAFPGGFILFQKFREFRSTSVQRRSGLHCGCLWGWQSGRFVFRKGFQGNRGTNTGVTSLSIHGGHHENSLEPFMLDPYGQKSFPFQTNLFTAKCLTHRPLSPPPDTPS